MESPRRAAAARLVSTESPRRGRGATPSPRNLRVVAAAAAARCVGGIIRAEEGRDARLLGRVRREAVAVVRVPVDERDPVQFMFVEGVRGGRGGKIVEAEAVRRVARGVMARRPAQREARLAVAQRAVDCIEPERLGPEERGVRAASCKRVRREPSPSDPPRRGRLSHTRDVLAVVHAQHRFERVVARRRRRPLCGGLAERRRDVHVEARGRLRVAATISMLRVARVEVDGQRCCRRREDEDLHPVGAARAARKLRTGQDRLGSGQNRGRETQRCHASTRARASC